MYIGACNRDSKPYVYTISVMANLYSAAAEVRE